MHGDVARGLTADVADAERDEELAQRARPARLDLLEEPVERLVADAIEFEQLRAALGRA